MKLADRLRSIFPSTRSPRFDRRPPALVEVLEARIAPATFTWIAPGSGSWTTPANWSVTNGTSVDGIPHAGDDVTINPAAVGALITISSGAQAAHSLSIPGDDLLQITGGSLALGTASTINGLLLGNGTLTAAAQLTLTGAGSSLSDGAVLTGLFRNEGTLGLTGGRMYLVDATLNNAGTITQTVGSLHFQGTSPALHNLAGGFYEVKIAGDAAFLNLDGGTTGALFDNAGTLRRDGTGRADMNSVPFHNAAGAVIEVLTGALRLNAPGTMDGGAFKVSSGATLDLTGIAQTWAGTFTGSGAGTVTFNNGTITAGAAGATLNFPAGMFQWADFGVFASGAVTNTGSLTIASGRAYLVDATLNNAGTITQAGGVLHFQGTSPTLHNLAGGFYEVKIAGDASFLALDGATTGALFDNAGTLRRDGTGRADMNGVPFHNAAGGVIEVLTGALRLNAPGTMDGGAFQVSSGATLALDGIAQTWAGTFTGSGTGAVTFNNGTITAGAGGATLDFPAGMFQWADFGVFAGGTVTNTSSLTIASGRAYLVDATLNNAGTITQAGGVLHFQGTSPTLHNLAGGFYEVKIAGDASFLALDGATTGALFDNAGTLRRDGTGRADMNGVPFHNAAGGVIEVLTGSLRLNTTGTMDGGTFNVSNGATLVLDGIAQTWAGTFTGSGAGTVAFSNGTITAGAGGATLGFPAGMFQWTDLGVFASGTVTNTGALTIASGRAYLLDATLNNAGTITQLGGVLHFQGTSPALHNLASGFYEVKIAGDGPFLALDGATTGALYDNAGTLRRDGTGRADMNGVPFHNAAGAVIEVLNGSLRLNTPGTLDGGTFNVSNGATLDLDGIAQTWAGTFTGSGAGTVAFSHGTITPGAGGATLNFPAGMFQWSDLAVFATGAVTNTGSLTIASGRAYLMDATLSNAGTITQAGGVLHFQGTSPTLLNLAGGFYEVKVAGDGPFLALDGNTTGALFDSAGTLRRDGTARADLNGVPFHNAAGGVIEVLTGALRLNSPGTMDGGAFKVSSGATLSLDGIAQTWSGTFTGSGAGTVAFNNGTITPGKVGATLAFPAGMFQWADFGVFASGTVTNTGALTIASGRAYLVDATLNNPGTITQQDGVVHFQGTSPALHNLAGGLYAVKIPGDGAFLNLDGGTTGSSFDNAGTLLRDGSLSANFGSVGFTNPGTVEVVSGTLVVNNAVPQISGSTLTAGTWKVDAGATLVLPANIATNNTVVEIGGTAAQLDTISLNNGTLSLRGGHALTSAGGFVNNGTLSLGPGSVLTANGTFTSGANSTVEFQIDGTPASGNFGQLVSTGVAALAGTAKFSIANHFALQIGQQYTVASFPSHTGAFSTFANIYLQQTKVFDPVQKAASLQLNVAVNSADLTPAITSTPASGASGQNVTVNYTVTNLSTYATATTDWTDSVFLSRDGVLDPSDKLVGRLAHHGALAGGASYQASLTGALPGEIPGSYRFIVVTDSAGQVPDTNRDNNAVTGQSQIATSIPALTAGTPVSGTVASGADAWYRLDLPVGVAPHFHLSTGAAGAAELYVRQSDTPTLAQFDSYTYHASQSVEDATLGGTRAGTYYVLVHGREAAGGGTSFTLTADGQSFGITSIEHNSGSGLGPVTVTIHGSLFTPQTTFSLKSGSGAVSPAAQTYYKDASTVYATFDVTGFAIGDYAVQATDGATTATAGGAFIVYAGAGPGHFTFSISAPRYIRDPLLGNVVTLTYVNDGGADLPAELVLLSADHARFRLADQTLFSDNAIELLTLNPNGPAGILAPGAHGQIDVVFEPQVTTAHAVTNFTAVQENATGVAVNWTPLLAELRPINIAANAWSAISVNFVAQVGNNTALLDLALAGDATRLGLLGYKVTPDLGQYIDFELEKAGNFGGLEQQYYLGAFGRGQSDPLNEHVAIDAFGNALLESGSQARAWGLLPNGTFAPAANNSGSLVKLPSGGYRLTETSGVITQYRPVDGHIDFEQATDGDVTTFHYNAQGLVSGFTAANGDSVSFTYNAAGRIVSSQDFVGRVSTFTYDASNQHLLSIATASGTTSYTYITGQGAGREHALASITSAGGVQTVFTYDANGRLATSSGNAGALTVSYAYDNFGGFTTTDALGDKAQILRGPGGTVARFVDPLGHISSTHFDDTGAVGTFEGPSGTTATLTRNASGLTTGLGNSAGGQTTFGYTENPTRLTSITDPNGDTTQFQHDSSGLLTKVIDPDGGTVSRTFDAHGNILTATNESGGVFLFTYDAHNLLTRRDNPDGTFLTFTYDAHRNLLTADAHAAGGADLGAETFTYNSADRLTKVAYPGGQSLTYTYDAAGRRATVTDQSGFEITYAYDSLGRLSRVANATGGADNTLDIYTYDTLGRLSTETRGSLETTTYTYDGLDHVVGIVHRNSASNVVQSFTYTYTADHEVATANDPDGLTTYSYDLNGELNKVALPGGRSITYAYDANGNRTAVNDTAGGTTTYAHNGVDAYTTVGSTTLSYDPEGDLAGRQTGGASTSYQYDANGHLIAVVAPTGTTRYEYNALGQRSAVVQNGVRTTFLIDPTGLGSVFADYTNGAVTGHYATGLGLIGRIETTGPVDYYNYDVSGNTTAVTGSGGTVLNTYSYLPFGEKLTATGHTANAYTFNARVGVRDNADGLYDMRARVYDPTLGRFLQQDPLGQLSGQTNLYTYAGNSPISLTDPSGLQFIPAIPSGLFAPTTGLTTLTTNTVAGLSRLGLLSAAQTGAGAAGAGTVATGATTVGAITTTATATAGTSATVAATTGATAAVAAPIASAAPATAALGAAPAAAAPVSVGAATAFGALAVTAAAGYGVGRGLDRLAENEFPDQHDTFVKSLETFPGVDPKPQDTLNHDTADQQNYQKLREAAHTPNVKKYLDLTGAHKPPTPAEVANAADLARKEAALSTYDDRRVLHNLFPTTYPDPGPPPIPTVPTEFIRAGDPNNLIGPSGYGADALADSGPQPTRFDGYIQPGGPFHYTIQFENRPDASAPAQVVKVTETLDANLDLNSFQLGEIGFGPFRVEVPAGRDSYHTRVDATATLGLFVDVDASLDRTTRKLTVTFTSIDPVTGDLTLDALSGFLPANITPPQGDGFISYTVNPNAGLASGAVVGAKATIVFDAEAPIDTPAIHNLIDAMAPVSSITAFPGASTARTAFVVRWTGSDEAAGSGLAFHNIFYTDNDGQLLGFQLGTTAPGARFVGTVGHTYKFFSQASDNAGNLEPLAAMPDATITVVAPAHAVTIDARRPFSYTDANGDLVTVRLTGPGSAVADLVGDANPTTTHADLDTLALTNTTAKSAIGITVKKTPTAGDGLTTIGEVTGTTLGSFTAPQADLVIEGLIFTGTVGTVAIHDLLQSDPILANPAIQVGGLAKNLLTVTAHHLADGFTLSTTSTLKLLRAADIGEGSIAAAALTTLATTAGALNADLLITGAAGSVTAKTSVDAGSWSAASFASVSVGLGDFAADLTTTGKLGLLKLTKGNLTGNLTGGALGTITVAAGRASGTWTAASIGAVSVVGGSLSATVTDTGALTSVHVGAGDLSGNLTAQRLGAVSVTGGNFTSTITSTGTLATLGHLAALTSLTVTTGQLTGNLSLLGAAGPIVEKGTAATGTWSAGSFGAITVTGAPLAATISTAGAIGAVTVTGGGLTGSLTAQKFGAVTVSGGDLSGTLTSLATPAVLKNIAALASLKITGGNLTGDVRLDGALGSLTVLQDAHKNGGSISGAEINAAKIAAITVAKDLTNAQIWAGADLGSDHALGGSADALDHFAAGSIGAIKIGGATSGALIAAGLQTTDTILKNGDDTLLGGTIASLTITGTASADSYFAATKFTAVPHIAGKAVTLATDARFKTA